MVLSIFPITTVLTYKLENVNKVIVLLLLVEIYVVHLKGIQCLPSNAVLGQVLVSFILCGTHQTKLPVIVLTISGKASFYFLKVMLCDLI